MSHTALRSYAGWIKILQWKPARCVRDCVCLCSNTVAPPLSATVMKLEQSLSDLWQCHVWKHLFYINESFSHSPQFIIQSFWWIHPSSFRPHTIAEPPQSPLSPAVSSRRGFSTDSTQTFNLLVFFLNSSHTNNSKWMSCLADSEGLEKIKL